MSAPARWRPSLSWLAAALALLCSLCCRADLRVDTGFTQVRLAPHIGYLCDPTGALTLADIQQRRLQPLRTREVSFGFGQPACWFHFHLANASAETLSLVLASDFNVVDHIELYIPTPQGTLRKAVGDSVPYLGRELRIRTLAIPFQLPAQASQDYYLRVQTTSTMYLPLRLYSQQAFINIGRGFDTLIGLAYGIVVGLMLYHLFLWLLIQQKLQLLYIGYVSCTLLFFAGEQGSLFPLWPDATAWNNACIYTFSFLALSAGTLFSRAYLRTREKPRLHAGLRMLAIALALMAGVHVLLPTAVVAPANSLLGLGVIALLFTVGLKRWREGVEEARLFIIAWSLLLLIGAAFIILLNLGGSGIGVTLLGAQIAFAAQQVLLSIGLARQLKTLRQEKEEKEQHMLLAQAESAAKTDFLARMSHEIRTPMNAVLGVTQLLTATRLDATQQHYVQLLGNAGRLLMSVIDDILDYSKITSGNLRLETIPFDLHDLLTSVHEISSANVGDDRPVQLRCQLSADLPRWVLGDPTRLRQVLLNLLGNALKFTERGSVTLEARLVVRIDREHAQVCLMVNDTGIGLSAEQIGQLFTPFHQADASITRKYGGTGLGLAISRQLVERMGGSIHVSSRPGEGASFMLLLPFTLTQPPLPLEAVLATGQPWLDGRLSGLRLLLTEDNAVNQLVIMSLIRQLGIEPRLARNGEEAFALVSAAHADIDVVLMDCEMPILDGLQATRKIRQWEQAHGLTPVRIIALTGHALPEYQQRCFDAGMDDYLSKPLLLDELVAKLTPLVGTGVDVEAG